MCAVSHPEHVASFVDYHVARVIEECATIISRARIYILGSVHALISESFHWVRPISIDKLRIKS